MTALDKAPLILPLSVRSTSAAMDGDNPFPGPRLHPEVADALRAALRRSGDSASPVRIALQTEDRGTGEGGEFSSAVRATFSAAVAAATDELLEIHREAAKSAVIAVVVALALFALSEVLFSFPSRPLLDAMGRGLTILAWVALWHPADLLLYARLRVRRERVLNQRLADASVVVREG